MSVRLQNTFRKLHQKRKKALITYVTAGDPDLKTTKELVLALEKNGADIIELGVPFSDPMADGPVIQKASERALAGGVTLTQILKLVREIRRVSQVPLVLMGYYNNFLSHGLLSYAKEAAQAGVDGTIVVDLPPEESADLDRALKDVGISLIYLLAPTSDIQRISTVCSRARGFVYFVSITGVTGAKLQSQQVIREKIAEIRRCTPLPVAIGFGISGPASAKRMSALADGVVVGSAIVKRIEENGKNAKKAVKEVGDFVRSLKLAL